MENFLARCSVLTIIGGGFVATGDLAQVVSRGRHLVEAVDVPASPADDAAVSAGASAPPNAAPRATPPHHPAAAPPAPPPTVTAPPDDGRQPVDHRPPANGPDRIEVAGLQVGDRISIWMQTAAIGPPLRIDCDVIDPTGGELLVHGGTAGPPTRATTRSASHRPTGSLVRGSAVRLQRIGPGGSAASESLVEGTIVALARGT